MLLVYYRTRAVCAGKGGCLMITTNYGNDDSCGGYVNGDRNEDGWGTTDGTTKIIAMTKTWRQ